MLSQDAYGSTLAIGYHAVADAPYPTGNLTTRFFPASGYDALFSLEGVGESFRGTFRFVGVDGRRELVGVRRASGITSATRITEGRLRIPIWKLEALTETRFSFPAAGCWIASESLRVDTSYWRGTAGSMASKRRTSGIQGSYPPLSRRTRTENWLHAQTCKMWRTCRSIPIPHLRVDCFGFRHRQHRHSLCRAHDRATCRAEYCGGNDPHGQRHDGAVGKCNNTII